MADDRKPVFGPLNVQVRAAIYYDVAVLAPVDASRIIALNHISPAPRSFCR
jgi:hypothetical protein